MSEQSVHCASCGRYWRPEQMHHVAKQRRAPDGGPSGRCKACQNAAKTAWYYRVKADPERYAAYLAAARDSKARARAAWSDEKRRDVIRRSEASRDPAKNRARKRRYYEAHRETIRAQRNAWRRAYHARLRESDPERLKAIYRQSWDCTRRSAYRRRLAAVLRVAVRRSDAAGGGA